MTPNQFLQQYRYDERLVTGGYFSTEPLEVKSGDTVGVVLFNMGGPRNPDEVESFLYNLFMDPVIIDIPVPRLFRNALCQTIARKRSATVREEYNLIGGASPINYHTKRQALLLEKSLNERYGLTHGIRFRVYTAMRYGNPTSEDVALQLQEDGVNATILLPLYPHYSKTTTGASLSYWDALLKAGELKERPASLVYEYAAHPSYVGAINDRIDDGLSRFGSRKEDVFLLFSAHGTPVKEMKTRKDPYCCLVHSTVHRVMEARGFDRSFQVAFQSKVGPVQWLTPSTPKALEELAADGKTQVLVIPVAFVSDHVETVFELDIEVRHQAMEAGIEQFEVTEGLNDHPSFIDALADVALGQIRGYSTSTAQSRFASKERPTCCHQCLRITEATKWPKKWATRSALASKAESSSESTAEPADEISDIPVV